MDILAAKAEVEALLKQVDNPSLQEHFNSDIVRALITGMTFRFVVCKSQNLSKKIKYFGTEHWVLVHGKYYRGRDLPEQYNYGTLKECYYNSLKALHEYPENNLIYVEGYALRILPILHAWNIDAKKEVIDLTLRPLSGIDDSLDNVEYFGVQFKPSYLYRIWNKRQAVGSVIDNWDNGWPLLQNDKYLKTAIIKNISQRQNPVIISNYNKNESEQDQRFSAIHIPEVSINGITEASAIINSGQPSWPIKWHSGDCQGACCQFKFRIPLPSKKDFYHVTFLDRVNAILRSGLLPNQPPVWPQTIFGYIYAFADIRDALRWAIRNSVQPNMPKEYAIIGFTSKEKWEDDPNQGMRIPGIQEGGWFRSKKPVLPKDLKIIITYNSNLEVH